MRLGLCLWLVLFAGGCERETTPPLIQLRGVSPHELEEGDRLTLEGVGFPEGKVGHVMFRGDLHRAGLPAVTGVEIQVDAVVGSSSEVDIPVTLELERLFAGPGDHAVHTTFAGDITIAFAARSQAAPPVSGTLHDTWVDVRPPLHQALAPMGSEVSTETTETAEGTRTLAFLGIHPAAEPLPSGGILIESLDPGSRADEARLLPNDAITEVDGLRVLSLRDLVTAPGGRAAWLKIRRGGSPHEELARVALLGLEPAPAAALFGPALLLGVAALAMLVFFAPTPRLLRWLERGISARIRRRPRPRPHERGLFVVALVRTFGSIRGAALLIGGVSLLVAALPFARWLGLADPDAPILFVLAASALLTLALTARGAGFGLGRRLRAAAGVMSLAIAPAASIVGAVLLTGSLRIGDLVRAQGGWPWGWIVFKTPFALVLLAVAFVAVLAGESVASACPAPCLAEAESLSSPFAAQSSPSLRLFASAHQVYLVVLSALIAALYFGGWEVPGIAAEQAEAHLAWSAVGAGVYVLKTWALLLLGLAGRWLLPTVHADRVISLCWRWLVPVSLLSLAGAVFSGPWLVSLAGPKVETLVGAMMLALTLAVGLHVVTRVSRALKNEDPALDPFV